MRIDKFISIVYNLSRRDARDFIKNNDLKIDNSSVVKNDQLIDLDKEQVFLNGEPIKYKALLYIALNKPKGYVSATVDDKYPTVTSLVTGYEGYNLFMVGRLDLDTVGLIILTNDGKFAHHLTSPNHECEKKYYLETDIPFTNDDVLTMQQGFTILDGNNSPYITKPAKLEIINDKAAFLTISEGKYHQVKRMSLYCGKTVTFLKRVKVGCLELGDLDVGKWRFLTDEEVKKLKNN